MLKTDKAEKELEKFQSEKHGKDRLARMKKLAAAPREAGMLLLDRKPDGAAFKDWKERNKAEEGLAGRIDALTPKQRGDVFAALFPKLATDIAGCWEMLKRLPYQAGYSRKAFRAPTQPAATRSARLAWLKETIEFLAEYDPDIEWVATWAGYLQYGSSAEALGYPLAACLNRGGADAALVFDILKQSAGSTHPVGAMGRHVTRALLVCDNPEAWEFTEKLLLAAQRQEGLRQTVLESIDEANPEAFRRMLRLIVDKDLARFSATVRAVDVWLGYLWDSATQRTVTEVVSKVVSYLDDPAARKAALASKEGEQVYLALWSLAFDEVATAIPEADKLLADGNKIEVRFAVVTLLQHLRCPLAQPLFLKAMEDSDLRVAMRAFDGLAGVAPPGRDFDGDEDDYYDDEETSWKGAPLPDMFERMEALIARLPEKPQKLKPLVWPWADVTASREHVGGHLSAHIGKRPSTRLVPYLPLLNPYEKANALDTLTKKTPLDPQVRELLFTMARDKTSHVRDKAVQLIGKLKLDPGEPEKLEHALTRAGEDFRRAVLKVLLKQKEAAVTESVERLLASANANQRLAGLDVLVTRAEKGKAGDALRARGEAYRAARGKKLSQPEADKLDTLAQTGVVKPTLDDGLGLHDPAGMSAAVPPRAKKVAFFTDAAAKCVAALDALVHKHHAHSYKLKDKPTDPDEESDEQMIGTDGLPSWDDDDTAEQNLARLPLREVWEGWYDARPANQKDKDGLELYRAKLWLDEMNEWQLRRWKEQAKKNAGYKAALAAVVGKFGPGKLKYESQVGEVIEWLLKIHPPAGERDYLLDAAETAFTHVPPKMLAQHPKDKNFTEWRNEDLFTLWYDKLKQDADGGGWTLDQVKRLWGLTRWHEQPAPTAFRRRTDTDVLLLAYLHGAATLSDLTDSLIGPRPKANEKEGQYYWWNRADFDLLENLTERTPVGLPAKALERPEVRELVNRVVSRVLDVELDRGELETAATDAAGCIKSLEGAATLFRILGKLGTRKFSRDNYGQGRETAFSRLVRVTYPAAADTPETFAESAKALIKEGKATPERFMELGFFAPQWLKHVAAVVGWGDSYPEAAYWFMAHIPGARTISSFGDDDEFELEDDEDSDFDDDEFDSDVEGPVESGQKKERKLSEWEKILADRSPLSDEDRHDGAVDTAWFWRAFEPLGAKKWDALCDAAKFASDYGNGYKKAKFLSDVLRGKAKKGDLVAGVRDRQLKESVRCLGLLPLAAGSKRDADLMSRYKILHGYMRYAKSLGPMSREQSVRTAQIGLENLARTAGYPDPIRLEWAVEAEAIKDLKAGPVQQSAAGVTVTLSLDADGQPETHFARGDKELKQLPPAVRKDRKVKALLDRKQELKRSASRMKWSLEAAMIRGDTFTGTELRRLFDHPMLVRLLSRLVLLGDGIAGYPVADGQGLEGLNGKVEPVKADEAIRIAHCTDLFAANTWHDWQADCFRRERVQPFKQVFRELYVVSDAEKEGGPRSGRYRGQQINPKQGYALWNARGWGTRDEVRKRFHDAGITTEVDFQYAPGTPLEVEGMTLDSVSFYRRGEWEPMKLADVPPRLFSEVMRDCDLVVSVAHRGGVDPEASQSTVEMRASLLRETCSLLKIANATVEKNRVLIDGQLNRYSVHLGSGVVHRVPGGSVCIIAVGAQHRGRLFLPFADDDPKTAEVISKTILLARDHEIQDPGILDQLRRG